MLLAFIGVFFLAPVEDPVEEGEDDEGDGFAVESQSKGAQSAGKTFTFKKSSVAPEPLPAPAP